MKLGQKAMEALQAEITGRLLPGNELIMVSPAALKGTSVIAEENAEKLKTHFSEGFLRASRSLYRDFGVGEEPMKSAAWKMAQEAGATALYAIGEGGFLCALWKMAEASQVGLEADFRKIPIRQETIEICEVFDLNPYRLHGGGAILMGISAGEALVQEYKRMGLMAAVIGQANSGNDRLLYSGESARYLDRPAEDELWKAVTRF